MYYIFVSRFSADISVDNSKVIKFEFSITLARERKRVGAFL